MKKIASAVLAVMVAGCATPSEQGFQNKISAWKGKSEIQVVQRFGAPQGTYAVDGKKILSYKDDKIATLYGGGVQLNCDVNFTVERGIVSNVSYAGNNCTSN